MRFRQVSTKVKAVATAITRFAQLEIVLASVCLLIPAALIWFDGGTVRDSISAYYSMTEDQVYYFPLTVASMLFVVNGVVKEKHGYNTFLGVMLAGVILLNYDDFSTLHQAFAVAFFGGNAVVIVVFSSKKDLWFKMLLVALIALSMVGCFVFHWFTLFWAEWLSFAIIAVHYLLEIIGYPAQPAS
jgi:hypothetical protein